MSDKILPFNPLDKRNLGASVAEALLASRVHPLGEIDAFEGAGIYAIYYLGDFPAYKDIARQNRAGRFLAPIYVGKAVPEGARKGGGVGEIRTRALHKRLAEHADSIRVVDNLKLADFFCRFLVVEDIWIPWANPSSSPASRRSGTVWWTVSATTTPVREGIKGKGRAGTCCIRDDPGRRNAGSGRRARWTLPVRSRRICGIRRIRYRIVLSRLAINEVIWA
jgi:hypothetical protein